MRECCTYLGEEFEGPFSTPVEEVGEGSEDGSTRTRLGEAREKLMGRVLQRALLLHPDQTTYPVSSWKERDKLSTAWLMSLPGPHYGIATPAFSGAGHSVVRPLAGLLYPPRHEDREGQGGHALRQGHQREAAGLALGAPA